MGDFEEREKKWRELLRLAKPEDWKWQPPQEVGPIEPKEPPQNIQENLDEIIAKLPETEREILTLRFVSGLSVQEVAEMIGSGEVFVLVIEKGAIGRLADWLGAEEEEVYSWISWWGKRKTEAILAEFNSLLSRPSPECMSLDRLYLAHLRWDWTEQEKKHIRSCDYCRRMSAKVKERLWHPSSSQLWRYVTRGELSEDERLDIRYHLETDECQRCRFIAEKVFNIIASLAPWFVPRCAYDIAYDIAPATEVQQFLIMKPVPREPTTPAVAASLIPMSLFAEGFAGEVEERKVEIKEGSFHAQLKREGQIWIARAEAENVPNGSKALFMWITTDGVERFETEAEFKPAFGNWSYAEAVLESEEIGQLGEGYFVAVLLPPQ